MRSRIPSLMARAVVAWQRNAAAAAVPIQPGQLTFTVYVSVTYALK